MKAVYFLAVAGSCLSFSVSAQRPSPASIDTVYLDPDWAPTGVRADARYARLVRHGADGLPVGTVRDYYYPSWKKQGEGKLLREAPDVLSGLCTGWHENGQLAFRGTYAQGVAQGDFQQWDAAGKPLRCGLAYRDVFRPQGATTLYPRLDPTAASSTVYTVPVPAGLDGVFYALDVRDQEPQPWLSLEKTVTLAVAGFKAYTGDIAGMGVTLHQLTGHITDAVQRTAPATPTKCRYLVTADGALAQQFLAAKGKIASAGLVLNRARAADVVALPPGCRQFYVCISNDNYKTTALAQLAVKGVVYSCK